MNLYAIKSRYLEKITIMHTKQRWGSAFAVFVFLFLMAVQFTNPIEQDTAFHLFADRRYWLKIFNFADVISNLPFLIVGLIGIKLCLKDSSEICLSWLVFFIGLILVAMGSSYYHLQPNNQTLVWDRLPMTVSFMSLFVALVVENVSVYIEKKLLPAAILLGLSSVLYWQYSGDLRFYGLVQAGALIAIPVVLFFYTSNYSHRHYLMYSLLFYLLAKVFEVTDKLVFSLTNQLISGHTIKHLFAAVATYCVYLMLKKRNKLAS
jgi:hypothetical protein